MALKTIYPQDISNNYVFDPVKIEMVGGLSKLVAVSSPPESYMYAKLDNNKGLVAIDSSGNNRHGAFAGGYDENIWVPGKIGSAIQGINATTGFINFDQLIEFERDEPFSLEYWIKFTSPATKQIMGKQKGSGSFNGFGSNISSSLPGKIRFFVRDENGNNNTIQTVNRYDDGVLHHVVCTYSGNSEISGLNIRVDNVLDRFVATSGTLDSTIKNTADFQISGRDGAVNCLDNTTVVDMLLVYARELTTAEIAFRWNGGAGTLIVPGASTSFPIDNPELKSFGLIVAKEIVDFNSSINVVGSDEVRFVLDVNNVLMWFDGIEWLISSGYSESNTSAEIKANISSLISTVSSIRWVALLHSADGTTTPELLDVDISYNLSSTSPMDANSCRVFGKIIDSQNQPVAGVVISISLIEIGDYNSELMIAQNIKAITSDSFGNWEVNLIENENMQGNIGYKFEFKSSFVNKIYKKIVPNEIEKEFLKLIDL